MSLPLITAHCPLGTSPTVLAEWIETARSLNRPIPEPKGKLAYA